ncbi:hypothetical protein PFISCL1PPCAC_4914, partial [Pristionchus fissidentatus]
MTLFHIALILHSFLAIVSTLLNVFLLVIMALFTPEYFRSYSLLLKIHAFFDVVISLCSLSTMLRAIPCGWSVVYIPYGPCKVISTDLCYYLYSLFLSSNVVTFGTVLVSIGARFWILRFGHISKSRILVAQSGIFIPALAVLVS